MPRKCCIWGTYCAECRDNERIIGAAGLAEWLSQALGYVMEHDELTIQDFEALCPDANRRTLQRDLKAMVEQGLLIERGSGLTDPSRRYRLAEI